MGLFADFEKYKDVHGLIGLYSKDGIGEPTQNGALFTMEYLICLLEDDSTPHSVKYDEIERIKLVFQTLEILPGGLTVRYPGSNETDSMDNMGALLAFSALFGGRHLAKRIKARGENLICTGPETAYEPLENRKFYLLARVVTFFQMLFKPLLWPSYFKSKFRPKFFWNNRSPNEFVKRGWFGRSPGFMAKVALAADGHCSLFGFISIVVALFLGVIASKDLLDKRKLPYVAFYFLTNSTNTYRSAFVVLYKVWRYFLLKQYPNGIRDVYAAYYRDPSHPIIKYSKTAFTPAGL